MSNLKLKVDAATWADIALESDLESKIDKSSMGEANGVASLNESGKIPSSQLPSYVDDVLEYASASDFPAEGESGKIYVAIDTNITYRWSGTAYVKIGSDLALGETSSTAYRGDRGKTAYDHSQLISGNPHNVSKSDLGLSNVDNTSDANKPISAATQSALDTKAVVYVQGTTPLNANLGDFWYYVEANNYLCLTAEQANSTISMNALGTSGPVVSLEYSTDGNTWSTFTPTETVITLANVGDKAYFRGTNDSLMQDGAGSWKFALTGQISASGSVMSLLDNTGKTTEMTSANGYCFYGLFYECSALTNPPELPATVLANACYGGMFALCTSLTKVPKLPATTLATDCYSSMFYGCSALQVYSTSGEGHTCAWHIPESGTASGVTQQSYVFMETVGDFAEATSIDFSTYPILYTQNEPV